MYIPEGVPLTPDELIQQAKSTRQIVHANTRFNSQMLNSLNKSSGTFKTPDTPGSKLNPTVNTITKIGIDGKEDSKETPKVKGYGFVDASPSPMPGRSFGDASPMMIWGEIEGTPFSLDGPSTPHFPYLSGAPEFKIPDIPEREKIAINLEEKASAARRNKKNEALKHVQRLMSPSRNSPQTSLSDKINSMSPAAQRLLSSKLTINKSSATTPSPMKSSFQSPSPNIRITSPATSKNSIFTSTQSMENLKTNLKRQSTDSITDNLLKLPKYN